VAVVVVLLYAAHGLLRRIDSSMIVGPFAVLVLVRDLAAWRRGVTRSSLGFGRPTSPAAIAGWTVALLAEMTVPQLLRGSTSPGISALRRPARQHVQIWSC
jgi:hypothetical protein